MAIVKNNKKPSNTFHNSYILPADNSELCSFIEKYRVDMSEQIVSSINHAIENNLSMVEVFQFKNSDFVITLSKPHFKEHLDHIFEYYMNNENYELCPRVVELQNNINKKINNEKKKAEKRTVKRVNSQKRRNPGSR
jgi:hypothetical protein